MTDCFIIAETACAHDGSLERLLDLAAAAAEAGADAVQFQVWETKDIVVPNHPDIDLLRRIELGRDNWARCFKSTKQKFPELEIIACVGDLNALHLCADLGADAFKIHTSDLGNRELLEASAALGKRIDLSVGASNLAEIQKALDWIGDACPVWLMSGYQLFPTPTDGLNLSFLPKLQELFGCPVGYQDHSPPAEQSAYSIPAAALGTGIKIIEKHITDDRARGGTDSQAALEPKEFKQFVVMCRELAIALGDGRHRSFTEEEKRYRTYSKKSLVFAKDLEAGHKLTRDDLLIRRSGRIGLPADQLDNVIGSMIEAPASQYQHVDEVDFVNSEDDE